MKIMNVKDAIESVKNEAMTDVVLYSHVPELSLEDKMYLMYFLGTMKGQSYQLLFDDDLKVEFEA